MISKEEYKKTLIRIWDSVRGDEHKGELNCRGLCCGNCPLSYVGCGSIKHYADVVEFVEKWGKEHPIETNGSRFLENYPEAEVYGCDGEFIYIKFPFSHGVKDCAKIPKTWWKSEVDNGYS